MNKDKIKNDILLSAKKEFMEKGYAEASMRIIAQKANVTTGSLYNRFVDKEQMFDELVKDAANELYDFYKKKHDDFLISSISSQCKNYLSVSTNYKYMVDIIYDNFDSFKLIICKSRGSKYESYVDGLIDMETKSTIAFIENLKESNIKVNYINDNLNHMLSSAFFNGFFEMVAHDMPKNQAIIFVKQMVEFFKSGWYSILGIEY